MKYTIENTSHRGAAFKITGAMHVVMPGKKETVDCLHEISETKIEALKAKGVLVKEAKQTAKKAEA